MSDERQTQTATTTLDLYVIWSGEDRAWWRRGSDGGSAGCTSNLDLAGRWLLEEAERMTRLCGPEMQIQIVRPNQGGEEGVWMIYFDDAEVQPEVFTGENARWTAHQRFENISTIYNCHLFQRVSS